MHILLVEDHNDTRVALSRLLKRVGHDVTAAASVSEAFTLLGDFAFDILLSDIGLPDGSGLQVVAEAKKQQQFKQTVAITAFGSPVDRERGRAAGFDHYLTKPLDFGRLRALLATA
ncbi:hypothetical protein BH18VER1_BH18VER1_08380 [soil metagenome]